jgi:hypothetical protein
MEKIDRIKDEFEKNTIKDRRIRKRLEMTAEQLSNYPNYTIPQACKAQAEIKGAYRLFDNDKVTSAGILSGHREKTRERIENHDVVLLIQDTTTLNYSSHPCTEGLGIISSYAECTGLLLHTTLAVSTQGVPLGIMYQKYWTRDFEDRGKKHKRKKLKTEEKESYRWIEALEQSTEGISDDILTVTVADREADIYDLFNRSIELKRDMLIRAVGNRHIVSEDKALLQHMELCASAGHISVTIPRNAKEKKAERTAKLDIKYCEVEILPPGHRAKEKELSPIPLHAIYAKEIECEAEDDPIRWLLLTSLPVMSLADAVEKINWYKHRWRIERFHFTLKSGCKVEDLQLETIDRLENAIALYSIIAWKLIWFTYENRANPDGSCEIILAKYEWQSLWCMANQNPKPPEEAPSIHSAIRMIARLGGFMGRKNDGSPGTMVLWRGLHRLNDIASVWLLMNPINNVGND